MATSERDLDIPVAAGEGPFHCKGILYMDAMVYYRDFVPGGWAGMVESFSDQRLREYLSQRFVASGWYDVFPYVAAHRAAARAAGEPYLDWVRRMANRLTSREFRGIYKAFLKVGNPEAVVQRFPLLAAKYYDFIKVEVKPIGPNAYETRAGGMPTMVAPSYQVTTEVAVVKALEIAGARSIQHRWMPAEPDGEAHGLSLVRLRREVRWE